MSVRPCVGLAMLALLGCNSMHVASLDDRDVRLAMNHVHLGGSASALFDEGRDCMPELIPAALEEAERDEQLARRAVFLWIVQQREPYSTPGEEHQGGRQGSGISITDAPDDALAVIDNAMRSRSRPLRWVARRAIRLGVRDARCFAMMLDDVERLLVAWAPEQPMPEELYEALIVLDHLGSDNGAAVRVDPAPGRDPPLHPAWQGWLRETETPEALGRRLIAIRYWLVQRVFEGRLPRQVHWQPRAA